MYCTQVYQSTTQSTPFQYNPFLVIQSVPLQSITFDLNPFLYNNTTHSFLLKPIPCHCYISILSHTISQTSTQCTSIEFFSFFSDLQECFESHFGRPQTLCSSSSSRHWMQSAATTDSIAWQDSCLSTFFSPSHAIWECFDSNTLTLILCIERGTSHSQAVAECVA